MSCAVYSAAYSVAEMLSGSIPGLTSTAANGLINDAISRGLIAEEEMEHLSPLEIVDRLESMLNNNLDVDVDFKPGRIVGASSVERFKTDLSRSGRSTAYIGVDDNSKAKVKEIKTRLKNAYATAGKTIIDKDTVVNSDTVANVELTTGSSFAETASLCKRVLDAGGRLLMPSRDEIQNYAANIKDDGRRAAYIKLHEEFQNELECYGASIRNVAEIGRVAQITKEQKIDKLSFDKSVRAGNVTALNEDVNANDIKTKAKAIDVRVGTAFQNKDGASLKADGITAATLYDAILNGEVTELARQDSEKSKYSLLNISDIIPLRKDKDHVIYAEVTGKKTGVSKDQYIKMLNSGEISTGYSAASASAMTDSGDMTILSIKPLAEEISEQKEKKGKKSGLKKNSGPRQGYHYETQRYSYYDRKKKKRVWMTKNVEVKDNDETSSKLIETLNMLAKAQLYFTKKVGGNVINTEDNTKVLELTKSVEEKLNKVKKQDGDVEAAKAHEAGYATDKHRFFNTEHSFLSKMSVRRSMLADMFNGDYTRMDQFGKSLASYFRLITEQYVVPDKIKEYEGEVERLKKLDESGINEDGLPATRTDTNKIKKKIQTLYERIRILRDDGWLGATKIDDTLRASLNQIQSDFNFAYNLSKFIRAEKKKHPEKSVQEIINDNYSSEIADSIYRTAYYSFLYCDLSDFQFLNKMFDGQDEKLDEERARTIGEEKYQQERNNRTAEQQKLIDIQDQQIRNRRSKSFELRKGAFERMLMELTRSTGVKMTLNVLTKKNTEAESDEERSYELNDPETTEESVRDVQMTAIFQRSEHDSLSKELKRVLGSLPEYKYITTKLDGTTAERNAQAKAKEDEYIGFEDQLSIERDNQGNAVSITEWYTENDKMFGMPRYMPGGLTYNKLLSAATQFNDGRGFQNSDEMYEYLKDNEKSVTWYHGLRVSMDNDLSLRTAVFVAMRKSRTQMRSLQSTMRIKGKAAPVSQSWLMSVPVNYDENEYFATSSIQETISHGLVLENSPLPSYRLSVSRQYDSDIKKKNKKYYKGDSVSISNISLYNNSGLYNKGEITLNEDGTVKEMTGAYAFNALAGSLPQKMEEFPTLFGKNDETVGKVFHLLKAAGVDCSYDEYTNAFLTRPELFQDCVRQLKNLAVNSDPFNDYAASAGQSGIDTDIFFDHMSGIYSNLGASLVALSENSVESVGRFAGKQHYSYHNRTFLDDIFGELGATQDEDRRNKFINDTYLRADADSSFMMEKNSDGDIHIQNGILRDTSLNGDPKHDKSARALRKVLSKGFDANLGLDLRSDSKEYSNLHPAEKIMTEILNFFEPKIGSVKNDEKLTASLDFGNSSFNGVAKYSIPIMADSGNHYFIGWRRFGDYYGDVVDEYTPEPLDSHKSGSMLDNEVENIMQEYNRINVYLSDTVDGQEIARTKMPKTFDKNKQKFCIYPEMNNMEVYIEGQKMSFLDAIGYLKTFEDDSEVIDNVTIILNGKEIKIRRTAGVEIWRDMVMAAIQECKTRMFQQSMEQWKEMGLFEIDTISGDRFKFLLDDHGKFHEAYKQYSDRKSLLDRFLYEVTGEEGDLDIKINNNGDFYVEQTDKDKNKHIINPKHPAWKAIVEYEDSDYGIKKGQLMKELMSLKDLWRRSEYYNLDIGGREGFDRSELNIASAMMKICGDNMKKNESGDLFYDLARLYDNTNYGNSWRNKLVELMREYAWNKIYTKIQVSQLLVGDMAQFKNEGDFSKRSKGFAAAYERCDMTAVDTRNGDRMVKEYYGERRIREKKWQDNQKTITLKDFEAKPMKDGSGRIEGFHTISQFFNDELLPQLRRDLAAGKITQENYIESCEAYAGMNMTDGQSFRTLESMKKILDFLHLNTDSFERIYKAVVVEKRKLKWEEVQDFAQQMKTVSYGFQYVDTEYGEKATSVTELNKELKRTYSQMLADFTKDSQFSLLLYTEEMSNYLGDDSILTGVLKFASENQVDVIHFDSTKKTGQTNEVDISQCRNAQEAYDTLYAAMEPGVLDPTQDIFHAESWDRVGRQISMPEHLIDKEQGIGTQIDKLMTSELGDTWIASEEYTDPDTGETKYRLVTHKTKIKLRDNDGNVTEELSADEYKEMLNRLKITNMIESAKEIEKQLGSNEAFAKLILQQIDATDKYPDELKEMVKIDDEGHFSVPLDNPIVANAIQPIIASIIRKKIIKLKTCGGTAVQFSSVGRSEALKEVVGIDEETGQKHVKYIECMLPAWSKGLFQAFADKDGNIDIDKVPVHLKQMVGYRVPTEYMYSMAPLRVVGFLNQEQGSSIMLPQEITVWSGSDFDIDKMYLEIPQFEVMDKKKVWNVASSDAWNAFYDSNPEIFHELQDLWINRVKQYLNDNRGILEPEQISLYEELIKDPKMYSEQFSAFRKQYCKIVGKGKGRLIDVMYWEPEVKERLPKLFNNFLERYGMYDEYVRVDEGDQLTGHSTQEEIENASRMARNNLFVKLHFARLASDHTFNLVNQPGGFARQKKLANMLTVLKAAGHTETAEELRNKDNGELADLADQYEHGLDVFSPATDDVMFLRNMIGKTLIGIYALHNAFHAVIQSAPCTLTDEFVEKYGFTIDGKAMRTRLGDIQDETGQSIIRNIGGLLAAAVDNAKDPVLAKLYQSPLTADVTCALLHMGYSLETVMMIVSQPIMRELIFQHGSNPAIMFSNSILRQAKLALDLNRKQDLTTADLEEGLAKDTNDLWNDPVQMQVLQILSTSVRISKIIKQMMDATKITSSDKNFANDLGENLKRMKGVKNLAMKNSIYQYDKKTNTTELECFIFNMDEVSTLVMDDFDNNMSEPRTVDEYINGVMMPDGRIKKARLPYVQACYDFGFVRPMRYMSRYLGVYGYDMMKCIDKLNGISKQTTGFVLSPKLINNMAKERTYFMSINALFNEEKIYKDASVSEVYRGFLTSFPEYYSRLLKKYSDKGRNLQKEFAILRHIVKTKGKRTKGYEFLQFSRSGKTDKMLQNELTSSWERLMHESDKELSMLALQLYKYSFLFNGCNYSPIAFGTYAPACVINEFPELNEEMKNLTMSMSEDDQWRFIDQFVRNNVSEMLDNGIIPRLIMQGDANYIIPIAFEQKEILDEYNKPKKRWFPKEIFYHNFKGDIAKTNYIALKFDSSGIDYIYRKEIDSTGSVMYRKVESLGLENLGVREYDRESDLIKPTKLGYESFMDGTAKVNVLKENNRETVKKDIQKEMQEDVMLLLTEMSESVTDDRTGNSGNDATCYILNGEKYQRVHDYMRESNLSTEVTKPNNYTDDEWTSAKTIGQAIGSAIDAYARLYFKKLNNGGVLSSEDEAAMHAIFSEDNEILKSANVKVVGNNYSKETMEDVVNRALDAFVSELKTDPDDKIITEINGKSIKLCAKVNTKNGVKNVGGEIDVLIKHADGSFSIADLKQMKDSNWNYFINRKDDTYSNYAVQLNCYRSLFKTLFPDATIKNLHVLPVLTERFTYDKYGKPKKNKENLRNIRPNLSEGDVTYWTNAYASTHLDLATMTDKVTVDIPMDTRLSGIVDPHGSKELENKLKVALDEKEITSDQIEEERYTADNDEEFNSYQEIFEKYLGDLAVRMKDVYEVFDNADEKSIQKYLTIKENGSTPLKNRFMRSYAPEGSDAKIGTYIPGITESLIDEIIDAVRHHREVRGDDNVKVC